ncbi:ImmA/IrrE family metallo-endopeptidase [Flavobacterium sp. 245]|uniref:ImmA/IrrE family metallo-endopeptidase n=1 Tax=Flavobacterium sp. 245 TaxID=2512115 RepID=UPI00105DB71F|nr:ImmA/IrrE family metallo-endopeptidase [Flavobacterium sp. 245]TDP00330.1 restriction endonuclease [Flavobacterium sp. 245]
MNTVKIGDSFEDKSYNLIEQALLNNDLSFIPGHCTIYRKKKYYNIIREKDVIFDLVIEVKHPSANKPSILCIIECKNYSNHSVPVDDLEEFSYKLQNIKGFTPKGILITNSKFQSGAFKVAENTGIMLIEVDEDKYTIVLHKNQNISSKIKEEVDFDLNIKVLIENALLPKKIEGLKKLNSENIEKIANNFLNEINPEILNYALPTPLSEVIKFLKLKKSLEVEFLDITDHEDRKILGYYDLFKNRIIINNNISNNLQYPFVLGHEIGHFILHRNLKINQTVYNNFKDVQFNFLHQSYNIKNDKHWIEWQANYFASCLLMPKNSIVARLILIQKELGISKQGTIFLDSQECNKKDYRDIVKWLSDFFNVGKNNIEYRLNDLGLINKPAMSDEDNITREFLRSISIRNSNLDF